MASSILRSSMHASHAPFGPGCNGQSLAAGVFPSVLSVKLPALLLADAMLFSVPGEVIPLSLVSLGSTTFSRCLRSTRLSTCLACCVVNLPLSCRPGLVRVDAAGCSTAL